MIQETVEQRFWKYVSPEPNSGCWLWDGAATQHGYGMLNMNGPRRYASHISLEMDGRPRPNDRAFACHHCDMPSCVNPSHLYWGDYRTNAADSMKRGRFVLPIWRRGEENNKTTLTADQVLEIRRSTTETTYELADRFGISQATAWNIRTRKTWRHI